MAVPDLEDQPMKELPQHCNSPYDFYKLFMLDKLVGKIVEMSKSCAVQKDRSDLLTKLNNNNLRLSHAIMYLTGYLSPSSRRMFWEDREDTKNILVRKAMSRTTFEDVITHTHFTDKVIKLYFVFQRNSIAKSNKTAPIKFAYC